jgi:gas vesicle protein
VAAAVCPIYPVERLSAFADGELSPAESQNVRAHAAGCPRCTGVLGELHAMAGAAATLERLEPPPTLWRAIEGELERGERPRWFSLSRTWRPFLVGTLVGGAAVAVLALLPARPAPQASIAAREEAPRGGAAVDPLLTEAEAEFAQAAAAYERSIAKLRDLLAREEARWSPGERTRTAERLARLDETIARSRELVRRTPGDSAGNEQLFAAYQQKIAFLAAAVHRGGEWQP